MTSRRAIRWCLLAAVGWIAVAGACTRKEPQRERGDRPAAPAAAPVSAPPVAGAAAVLATVAEEQTPPASPLGSGLGLHPTTPGGTFEFIFGERGGGVAYGVATGEKLQVVHDGRPGKAYESVRAISLTLDGRRCAYAALAGGRWRVVVDEVEGEPFSAVGRPVFSPDGAHVAHHAMRGERWYLVVDGKVNGGTPTRFILTPEFGGDSARVVFVDDVVEATGAGKLVVSDLGFGRQTVVDPSVTAMLLSPDRARVAGVAVGGAAQRVISAPLGDPNRVERGPPFDAVEALAFGPDGASLAYVGTRAGKRFLVLNGREAPLPDGHVVGLPAVRPDGKGAGVLLASERGVTFQEPFDRPGPREPAYEEAEGPVYGRDGAHAYAARRGDRWFVVANGTQGPAFDRVVTPAFTPDGEHLVYRARQDGRRFAVVADRDGKTIRQHAEYEQVFPLQFTADGRSVAYGVKDGPRLAWKVEPL